MSRPRRALWPNEGDVGRAVADSGIPREQIFITAGEKVWADPNALPTGTLGNARMTDQHNGKGHTVK